MRPALAIPRLLAAAALAAAATLPAGAAGAEPASTPLATLAFTYAGEAWRNAGGGLATGHRYLGSADLVLEVDGGRAFGWAGTRFLASALYTNGHAISELTGAAQGSSGIEAPRALRLYEAWLERRLGNRQSLRFGLYDLNAEFDAIDTAALFAHPAHGMGTDFAQSGLNGPSSFPVTGLGLRWRLELPAGLALQLGVTEGTPGDAGDAGSSRLRFEDGEGALFAGELQFAGGRLRKAALGHWRYTAEFDDLLRTDVQGEPLLRRGNAGWYAYADVRLAGAGDRPALDGWLRAGTGAAAFNQFDRYLGAGLVWSGALGRADDQLGLAVATARNGGPYRRARSLAGRATTTRETSVELAWRTPLAPWLALQPALLYTRNPGTDPALEDSLAVLLRFELGWSRDW